MVNGRDSGVADPVYLFTLAAGGAFFLGILIVT
jgi:hypothetical protein